MFSRIVVAVDLAQPELAERALRHAAALAKAFSAEVRLVYVRPFMIDAALAYLPPEEVAKVPNTPGSLEEALNNLEADHEYLLKGDVFTQDVIDTWISYKRRNEVDALRLRPHPYEFALYYDI